MGFQTQSPFPGQAYSINSTNSVMGGSSRQTGPLPTATSDVPLVSQKSIYSLTLEEFQNTLGDPGKSFGSMNMEDLLKNIWTAEEGQAMAAAMGGGDASGLSKQASLQKQGSLSLKGALGRRTVDEVWSTLYQAPVNPTETGQWSLKQREPTETGQWSLKQREPTFKEVTLEDFLMKAGIVPEEDAGKNTGAFTFGASMGMDGNVGNNFIQRPASTSPGRSMFSSPTSVLTGSVVDMHQSAQVGRSSLSFQSADMPMNLQQNVGTAQNDQLFKQSVAGGVQDIFAPNCINQAESAGLVGLGGLSSPVGGGIAASLNASTSYGGFSNPLSIAIPAFKAESPLSSDGTGTSQGSMPISPVYHSGILIPLRKRLAEGQLETVVERRQRRMIKNRESAARSRARRQAYTVELENELTELREENVKLKQKQERAEKQLKKVLAITHEAPKQQRVLMRSRTT